MKKVLAVLLVLLAPLAWAQARTWLSAVVVNPTTNQVLLDTGAVGGPANYDYCVYVASNANTVVQVQRRNAANSATVAEQYMAVPAFSFASICPLKITLADQERLRLIAGNNVTGSVSVSLTF
jgi:hypothetical protein